MEASVVGSVVGATVQVVLQNLISVSMKEIKLIRGFKKDMQKLRTTLVTIQEFVYAAQSLQVTDLPVNRWLKKLEDVAFEAYNVLDEIDYLSLREDRYKMEAKTTFKKKIRSIASGSNFGDRRKFGHKIRDINKDFESINREASGLGLPTRLAGLHVTGVASHASASEETDSFTSDPVFLGRDDDVKEILEKLNSSRPDQVFSILPIVGMGGMGKSTLVREVVKVQTRFQTHIWVHVSATFDPIMLFKKILMVLTSEDVKVENREVVLKKLQEALKNKTYLLVLDDVWNEEGLRWEGFINSLSGITSTTGNGIIITTRRSGVGSIVATLPLHDLKGLPDDKCWSIIKAKAFGGDIVPSEFETLGRNIAKRCRGLPLAANVVGGVLRGKSEDEWLSIQENWLSNHVEGEFIKKVLKLSYDNLSSPSLKKCFTYCSIFPKGACIMRADLIELWMAEGYLEAGQKSDMETVGNTYFNLLLHNSLLQDVHRDDFNRVASCSMHDLVHDAAMQVNDSISDGIYRACGTGHEFYGDESKEKAKFVRTLFFRGVISDVVFSEFKSLHSLTLMGNDVKVLPSSIRELRHLRYLNISDTNIDDIPDTIGELYHLLTFRAELYRLRKLPSTLKYLIDLRHLYVYDGTKLPGELGTLTSLQTLPYFAVGDDKGHRIGELGSLKNLNGKLKIYNLENVSDKEEATGACIFQNPNIVELVLRWNGPEEGETNHKNVLDGLQPHPNLKGLEIEGFKGSQFSSWVLKMGVQDEGHWKGLNNLMKIRLSSCSKCEEIPTMGHLPHLKTLILSGLKNVKSIGSSFYGIDHCVSVNNGVCEDTIIVFPALQRIELWNMPNMSEWEEVKLSGASENRPREVKVFPCLEFLQIRDCRELRSAPSQFSCLKNLSMIGVKSGLPLKNICSSKFTSLTRLNISKLEELESLPHGIFYNNQQLSELHLLDCPRLRELPDGMHTLNSLWLLSVEGCPSLKSSIGSFSSVRNLEIGDCGELMNSSCEMLESCAASLEDLIIGEIRSENMQMIIDFLHKTNMPRLTTLWLSPVPKFIITSSADTPTLPVLRHLWIVPDSDSWDCVSFKKAVNGILRLGSSSLHILQLLGKEDWESLPDQLQHLSALEILDLSDFGIQELPEWIGNLSSLQALSLSNCKRLRGLPSVGAMRCLTNLKELSIRDCPVLKERGIEQQSETHDSEWPKISHISTIYVDRKNVREQ